jgi:hypothetical protein
MYKILRQAKAIHKGKTAKLDMAKLLKAEGAEKYRMEKSYEYIGYKLLWILEMFLDGKRFPYGSLTEA